MKIRKIRSYFILLVFVNIIYSAINVTSLIISGYIFDLTLVESLSIHKRSLIVVALSLILGYLLFGMIRSFLKSRIVSIARNDIEGKLCELIFMDKETEGDIVNMYNNEANLIVEKYVNTLGGIAYAISSFVFAICYTSAISYKTIIAIILIIIGLLLIDNLILKPVKKIMEKYSCENEKFNDILMKYMESILTVSCYDEKNETRLELDGILTERNREERLVKRYSLIVNGINCFFLTLVQIAPLAVLILMLYWEKITIGETLAFMLLLEKISSPIDEISNIMAERSETKNAILKYQELVKNLSIERKKEFDFVQAATIEVKNLHYSIDGQEIIKQFNYKFNPDCKYLICGKNGTGKSTFIKILTKEIEEYDGDIFINGINLRDISKTELSRYFGVIPQIPEIIFGSVEENIVVGNDVEAEKMDSIKHMLGLDKLVHAASEEVNNLSGGEKQRISLARLFYNNKSINILDEALTGIDYRQTMEYEKQVIADVKGIVINISHKTDASIYSLYDDIIAFPV